MYVKVARPRSSDVQDGRGLRGAQHDARRPVGPEDDLLLSALERRDPAHAALPSSSVAPLRAQSLFQVIVGWSAMK